MRVVDDFGRSGRRGRSGRLIGECRGFRGRIVRYEDWRSVVPLNLAREE